MEPLYKITLEGASLHLSQGNRKIGREIWSFSTLPGNADHLLVTSTKGLLTDIGTEELAHMEMISAIVHQLTRDLTVEQIQEQGFADYFVDHTLGLYPVAASGTPFRAEYFQSKGDVITDLHEDMAAEQKARTTYDNILRLVDDPDILDPIRFLREREIVHYQRFGEALRYVQDQLHTRNFYACNPGFDPCCGN